jgi:hypothetical protein
MFLRPNVQRERCDFVDVGDRVGSLRQTNHVEIDVTCLARAELQVLELGGVIGNEFSVAGLSTGWTALSRVAPLPEAK